MTEYLLIHVYVYRAMKRLITIEARAEKFGELYRSFQQNGFVGRVVLFNDNPINIQPDMIIELSGERGNVYSPDWETERAHRAIPIGIKGAALFYTPNKLKADLSSPRIDIQELGHVNNIRNLLEKAMRLRDPKSHLSTRPSQIDLAEEGFNYFFDDSYHGPNITAIISQRWAQLETNSA